MKSDFTPKRFNPWIVAVAVFMATVILGTAIMYFAGRAIYPKSEIESGGRSAENIDFYKPGSAAETGGEAGALSGGAAAASEPAVHESDDAMARYEEIDRMFASGELTVGEGPGESGYEEAMDWKGNYESDEAAEDAEQEKYHSGDGSISEEDRRVGNSQAFEISPIPELKISAPENALDKDRTFEVKRLTGTELDTMEGALTAVYEDALVIDGFEIDAGLDDNETLPGKYSVELDLDKLDILPELYDYVSLYRVDDSGKWYEYAVTRKGNSLCFESSQNSAVITAITWVAIRLAIISLVAPSIMDSVKRLGIIGFRGSYMDLPVEVSDEKGNSRAYHILYKSSATEFLNQLIKKKKKESYEKLLPVAENRADRFIKANYLDKQKTVPEGLREKLIKEAMLNVLNDAQDAKEAEALEKIRDEGGFDYISDTKYMLIAAHEYLKSTGVKLPSYDMDVYLVPGFSQPGATQSPVLVWSLMNPYLALRADYDDFVKNKDLYLYTMTHELFHACQREYKTSSMASYKFDEASGTLIEWDSAEHYKNTASDNPAHAGEMLTGTDPSIENRDRWEYFAIPLNRSGGIVYGTNYYFSGTKYAEIGYPLMNLLEWFRNTLSSDMSWGEVMKRYGAFYRKPDFTTVVKAVFDLKDEEDLDNTYKNFAIMNAPELYRRVKQRKEEETYPWLYPIAAGQVNGERVELENNDYTIRVRKIVPYLSGKKRVSVIIKKEEGFDGSLNDMRLQPIQTNKWDETKDGFLWKARKYEAAAENTWLMEIDGGTNGNFLAKSAFRIWTVGEPEVIGTLVPAADISLKEGESPLNYPDETAAIRLPEMSDAMKNDATAGLCIQVTKSDGTKGQFFYDKKKAGQVAYIDYDALRPEGAEADEGFSGFFQMAEYVLGRDGKKLICAPSDRIPYSIGEKKQELSFKPQTLNGTVTKLEPFDSYASTEKGEISASFTIEADGSFTVKIPEVLVEEDYGGSRSKESQTGYEVRGKLTKEDFRGEDWTSFGADIADMTYPSFSNEYIGSSGGITYNRISFGPDPGDNIGSVDAKYKDGKVEIYVLVVSFSETFKNGYDGPNGKNEDVSSHKTGENICYLSTRFECQVGSDFSWFR